MCNSTFPARPSIARYAARIAMAAPTLTIGVVLLVTAFAPLSASANGVPQRIQLTYQPGLSNWGPQDAHGEAELSYAEMVVHLTASGLPALSGESYSLWLANSTTNKAVPVGTLAGAPDGSVAYDGKLTNLDGYDYDLLMVTVQPGDGSGSAPSAKRSIGGFFTAIQKQDVGSATVQSDTQPSSLPNTGDMLPASSGGNSRRHAIAMVLFAVGGVSLYLTMRTARTRRTRDD